MYIVIKMKIIIKKLIVQTKNKKKNKPKILIKGSQQNPKLKKKILFNKIPT